MKVGVTSANGQLGSTIINQLKQDIGAESVIGLARSPEKASHLGVEIRKGDYNQASDFEKSLAGVDGLIILSANGDPAGRVQQHRNIIEGAKKNGVKKIGYTSITGDAQGNAFSPVVASNRQTEQDIIDSGIDFVIGRNGLYIEADLEYVEEYKKEGVVRNSAADGKCAYTSRPEIARAFSELLRGDRKNEVFYLVGEPVTQEDLVQTINKAFDTGLSYQPMGIDDYVKERQEALGEFLGTIIGGIYAGINTGAFDVPSDFENILGRKHKDLLEMAEEFKSKL